MAYCFLVCFEYMVFGSSEIPTNMEMHCLVLLCSSCLLTALCSCAFLLFMIVLTQRYRTDPFHVAGPSSTTLFSSLDTMTR